jgi:hypothetical protein
MFASKSIGLHLARGVVGLAAIAAAMAIASSHPWVAVGLLPFAFFALRGCPMCWTLGLIQTVQARLRGRAGP